MSADFDLEGVVLMPRHHMGALGVSDDAPMYAPHATDLVLPASERPTGPLPPPAYAAATVAPTVAPTEGGYFKRTVEAQNWIPVVTPTPPLLQLWKVLGIVAGVAAVGGLVTWMFVKTTRGFRRPAIAGLAGMSRGRRRRRRR